MDASTAKTILDGITNFGIGTCSFAALLYGGWKGALFAQNFVENHMAHVQASLDELVESSKAQNALLADQTKKLDILIQLGAQGNKNTQP